MISTQDAFGEALRVKSQKTSVLMETSNLSLITDNSSLIEELLQTIESLDSTMREMREEISFLRERLSKMDASLEEKELEQKRLLAIIEAKDEDNKRLGKQIADLLGKVAALTSLLEDKNHQLQDGRGLDKAIPCEGHKGDRRRKQGLCVPASRRSIALDLVKNQKFY